MSTEDISDVKEPIGEQEETMEQTSNDENNENITGKTPPPVESEKKEMPKFIAPAPPALSVKDKMLQEEAKLKTKYPNLRVGGGSALLAKRLNQQKVKYFDSGDYNMAMAKKKSTNTAKPAKPAVIEQEPTGEEIPTPETVPARKMSLATSSRIPTGMLS